MSAKIIDSRRYKTITKTQLDKKRKKARDELKSNSRSYKKSNSHSSTSDNNSFITNLRIKKQRERKLEREMLLYSRPQRTVIKEPKQKIYIPKSFVISCCVLLLVLIVYISAKVMNIDKMIAVNVFNSSENKEEKVNLENNYELKVGLMSLEDKNIYTSTNLILNDIYKATTYSLVTVGSNYEIKYQVARKIEKISNKEYDITLNNEYKLDIEDVRFSVNKILEAGTSNMYYSRLSSIESIEETETKGKFKITLKEDNPYFIYYLDFPLIDNENQISGGYNYTNENDNCIFTRAQKNENLNLASITLNNYGNIQEIVNEFIDNKIDVFFATSNNDMQLIGKKDYNVKKYKDGETLFIFGNKNSNLFIRDEVRKALMYSLDRDDIVKNSDNNFIEIIDLPYLYSSIKYKYDIVGSKNIMESNGWRQNQNGVFGKYEDSGYITASLRLLVNEGDTNKQNVANNIKNMALNVGIDIQIESLPSDVIQQRIDSGDYDLVLATVYLNETPDIRFLRNYLDINDTTTQAFAQVENSNSQDLEKNVQNLLYVLSDQVSCIGIYARNINLVYQKDIYGFNDLNYMNIFTNINEIGKLAK